MLVNFTGRHRLTPKTRAVRLWTRVRYAGLAFPLVMAFWLVTIAVSGLIAGFVWGRAL